MILNGRRGGREGGRGEVGGAEEEGEDKWSLTRKRGRRRVSIGRDDNDEDSTMSERVRGAGGGGGEIRGRRRSSGEQGEKKKKGIVDYHAKDASKVSLPV